MATPRIPNQKKQYQLLNRRLAAYMAAVRRIYGELGSEAAKIAASTGYDGKKPFAWKDYPKTKARVQKLQESFVSQLGSLIMSGTSDEWRRSNLQQDLIVDNVLKGYHTSRKDARNERYYRDNSEALQAFQQRKERGMNLSDKLWDQSQAYREELQDVISAAIERGTDAITLSKQVSKYLQDFPSMQRDYKELYGKASKVQNCEYRSIRLARSEINMAYRTAEQQRWRQLDFVVGYEIKMSGAHPAHDVCDELAGKYPKDFKWNGWHPNCYTDKAMVLTNNGWKHFSDVESTDSILSLNPDTRDVEWVKFVARQCYPYSGKMIRFFNKSLECVVTPEHQMVYLSKTKGDIRRISAIDYRKGNGAFYRTCEHRNPEEKQSIEINGDVWSFDDYCEFMGYWLADGSTQHTTGVALCQKKGEPAWDVMISCLERLGYHYIINEESISFYKSNIVRYLKQFGNAYNKFIPAEILSASKRQMQIFLDAFIKCDGYTRKTKSFVGNRGNVFSSKNDERMYFTTSPHLAGDLCQLLIMLGKRPSFKIKEPVTITKKDGSIIKGNYPCFVISECLSGTATVFDKEMVDYSGNVYDLTLEKNHIMYISYDGKCFWGSNCMCYEVPILKTEDEFYSEDDKPSANEVNDVPQNFRDWSTDNWHRIEVARNHGTLPYFISDNSKYVRENLTVERAAELRHAKRDAEAIQRAWSNRQYLQSYAFSRETMYDYSDYLSAIKQARYYGIDISDLENYVQTAKSIDAKKFEKMLSDIDDKVFEKHSTVLQYKYELQSIFRQLHIANGQYQMKDIQDEILQFIEDNHLASGPADIHYGDTMPLKSTYRQFANAIKKKVVDRSKAIQEKTGLSPKLPSSIYPGSRYLRGEEYVFDKRFFDLISDDVRWDITSGEGVSNWDGVRTCTIYDGDRSEKSPYHRKNVIYHEGGHSIFSKKKLYEQAGFKDLFDYARREIGYEDEFPMYDQISGWGTMRTTRGNHIDNYIERILSRLNTLDERDIEILERHGFNPNDIREALGSCADLLMSIDQRYGFGHRYRLKDGKWYYDHPNMPETEFTAHCFEAKFHGNPFMKKFMPDIYARILSYVESLL